MNVLTDKHRGRWYSRVALTVLAGALLWRPLAAQSDFQIVWVVVGEAATANAAGVVRAGRQLFAGGDLAQLSLKNVRVTKVDVTPSVTELAQGQEWCLSTLTMQAFGADRAPVPEAPLSVTVRQDQRMRLNLRRSANNICVAPSAPGEYPLRLTSLLPAPDGSIRGAQVFVRVSGAETATAPSSSSE